jgi:methionyl-tRNA formyltransferase
VRVVFIGCVSYSAATLRHILSERLCDVVGVVTRRESAFNADFVSLEAIARDNHVPCFIAEGNNQDEMAAFIEAVAPDVIYCFGWSYLLKARILGIAPLGVVGYHPAALPLNRGRHPIVWALALGLPQTASTFFLMDEGADSGDILSQRLVAIAPTDDAGTLYGRLTEVSLLQISELTRQLSEGRFVRSAQDHSRANVWRKRGKLDGQIDWRMSAESITNLVRALTRPYIGAHCLWQGREVKIWRSLPLAPGDVAHLEPGKVLDHDKGAPIIKCGQGVIELVEHEFDSLPPVGSYL